MVEIKVTKVDDYTGICEGETASGTPVKFNLFGLQDGDSTVYSRNYIKPGIVVFVDEDSDGLLNNTIISKFYFKPPAEEMKEMIKVLKNTFGKARDYPLVGDYVIGNDKKLHRITIIDGDQVQFHSGSYFFGWANKSKTKIYVSHSGSCGFPESLDLLKDTGRYENATFWTFKDFGVRGHNGIDHEVKVKVWQFTGKNRNG